MGGVAVIHNPQDSLRHPFSNQAHFFSGYMKPSRNYAPNRTNRRKKTPSGSADQGAVQSRSPPVPKKATVNKIISSNEIVTGHVRILKRGEDLVHVPAWDRVSDVVKVEMEASERVSNPGKVEMAGSALVSDIVEIVNNLKAADRLGPEPEMLTKQIGVFGGFYSGSAIIASPPPSSLPLPGFFSKNDVIVNNKHATNDLLRMLRLNLA